MSKKNNNNIVKAVNSKNQNIIDEFQKLKNLYKIENTIISDAKVININNFKIKSFDKNVRIISNYKTEIKLDNLDKLLEMKGVGKGTIERIEEILNNGYLQEVKDLDKKYKKFAKQNQLVNELTSVIGIGNVVAKELISKFKIKSLAELKKKVDDNKIEVNDKIKLGLKFANKFKNDIPRKEINETFDFILSNIKDSNIFFIICGSYRRGLPTSNDIDILLCDTNVLYKEDLEKSTTLRNFIDLFKKKNFIMNDLTSANSLSKYMGLSKYKDNPCRRIDIRMIPYESIFTAITYFTGSYQLNVIMRSKAKELGYKLNEYGLYKNDIKVNIDSEEELFQKLHMKYLEPEQRSI